MRGEDKGRAAALALRATGDLLVMRGGDAEEGKGFRVDTAGKDEEGEGGGEVVRGITRAKDEGEAMVVQEEEEEEEEGEGEVEVEEEATWEGRRTTAAQTANMRALRSRRRT